ncbi:MAG: hypothetical protein HC895_27445 [Leptolyngbyaceae cyanobacterium SM1_3_5]|nr:hypothetical protein [Leptolyngbyaceae cyanobacterium SM1_3_5]
MGTLFDRLSPTTSISSISPIVRDEIEAQLAEFKAEEARIQAEAERTEKAIA